MGTETPAPQVTTPMDTKPATRVEASPTALAVKEQKKVEKVQKKVLSVQQDSLSQLQRLGIDLNKFGNKTPQEIIAEINRTHGDNPWIDNEATREFVAGALTLNREQQVIFLRLKGEKIQKGESFDEASLLEETNKILLQQRVDEIINKGEKPEETPLQESEAVPGQGELGVVGVEIGDGDLPGTMKEVDDYLKSGGKAGDPELLLSAIAGGGMQELNAQLQSAYAQGDRKAEEHIKGKIDAMKEIAKETARSVDALVVRLMENEDSSPENQALGCDMQIYLQQRALYYAQADLDRSIREGANAKTIARKRNKLATYQEKIEKAKAIRAKIDKEHPECKGIDFVVATTLAAAERMNNGPLTPEEKGQLAEDPLMFLEFQMRKNGAFTTGEAQNAFFNKVTDVGMIDETQAESLKKKINETRVRAEKIAFIDKKAGGVMEKGGMIGIMGLFMLWTSAKKQRGGMQG